MKKITVKDILSKKGKEKITALTCYDYSFAKILDEAGMDIILVGDSLANVVLGMDETRHISVREMLNHTKAVARAVEKSLVIADMPYKSYQKDPLKCVDYAEKFIAAGADAVKVEWFSAKDRSKDCAYVVQRLVKNKIPVMGHVGLTPQTAHLLGGYKVQGKDMKSAKNLMRQSQILQDLGVFSIVLECIPSLLAKHITDILKVPTIGIGAGAGCDGQVLVLYDLLGLYKQMKPKFVRVYTDLASKTKEAVAGFIKDVQAGSFPDKNESFSMRLEEWELFKKK